MPTGCILQVAISSVELIGSIMVLASSDNTEVQTVSMHCLARFAAWQGVAQQTICTLDSADVRLPYTCYGGHLCHISPF